MNSTLYLSCLVVIVGSLVWTASAAPSPNDNEFNSELMRLKNIYGNDAVHQVTKYRNVPDLINFYEKYSHRLQLTPEERREGDEALGQYKESQAKILLVEGAPAQGFWGIVIPIVDIITKLLSKAVGA